MTVNTEGIDSARDEFQADMEKAKNLLELVGEFRDFASSAPDPADQGDSWPEAKVLHARTSVVRTSLPTMAGSMVLYIAGRYEFFVRQIVEACAQEMVSHANSFDELPKALRTALRAFSLEVAKSPNRYQRSEAEANTVLDQYTSAVVATGNDLLIASGVISITDANMKAEILNDVLKRVGLSDFWREACKQNRVKLYYEENDEGSLQEKLKNDLNELMNQRNQIAHPTSSSTFPNHEQVLERVKFLGMLSDLLAEQAKIHVVAEASKVISPEG